MKKTAFLTALAILPTAIYAQTALDAFSLSRSDLRGTARFMSMGGAFGALGGDLSTLTSNPAGLGVYRKSDIGISLNVDFQQSTTSTSMMKWTEKFTKASIPNLGYAGSVKTGSDIMPFFNWGISYGRTTSFNRRYRGADTMRGSLSNYIAGYTTDQRWTAQELEYSDANYYDSYGAPWMSILANGAHIINRDLSRGGYSGLWDNGHTHGESEFTVQESGYVDDYSINLGGNFADIVYWGIGFGITDIDYTQNVYYEEYLNDALIPIVNNRGEIVASPEPVNTPYDVGFGLESAKHISGTGFNIKAGVIVRPIDQLRIGFAVHSPTYYSLTQESAGVIDYAYGYDHGVLHPDAVDTPWETIDWKLRTPWRLQASVATVLANRFILSAEYEYRPYTDMTAKTPEGQLIDSTSDDVHTYYKDANTIRLGAEMRLNKHWSLRAGFAHESAPTATELLKTDSHIPVCTFNPYDTDTTPSYSMDRSTTYLTGGIGFKVGPFYADAAYVHKQYKSQFEAYTPNAHTGPGASSQVSTASNQLVLSVGFRF